MLQNNAKNDNCEPPQTVLNSRTHLAVAVDCLWTRFLSTTGVVPLGRERRLTQSDVWNGKEMNSLLLNGSFFVSNLYSKDIRVFCNLIGLYGETWQVLAEPQSRSAIVKSRLQLASRQQASTKGIGTVLRAESEQPTVPAFSSRITKNLL